MSELTEALESIRSWLEQNQPYEFSRLRAGLSRDEIDELVKDLPFKVPEEIYELYQWHDGVADRFLCCEYDFMCLQEAISTYHDGVNENLYYTREDTHLFEQSFPVFKLWYQGNVVYTVIASGDNKGKVMFYDTECSDYPLQYSSLTNLVKHGVEWCKLAYRNDEQSWEVDKDGKTAANLDTKYMLREHLADYVSNHIGSPHQTQIYKNFLENIE
jgi:SMI1 / KNR4 family (SUKH-1)